MNAEMGIKGRKISIMIQNWAEHQGLMLLSLLYLNPRKFVCLDTDRRHISCIFCVFPLQCCCIHTAAVYYMRVHLFPYSPLWMFE